MLWRHEHDLTYNVYLLVAAGNDTDEFLNQQKLFNRLGASAVVWVSSHALKNNQTSDFPVIPMFGKYSHLLISSDDPVYDTPQIVRSLSGDAKAVRSVEILGALPDMLHEINVKLQRELGDNPFLWIHEREAWLFDKDKIKTKVRKDGDADSNYAKQIVMTLETGDLNAPSDRKQQIVLDSALRLQNKNLKNTININFDVASGKYHQYNAKTKKYEPLSSSLILDSNTRLTVLGHGSEGTIVDR